jgi:transposase-like protein
MSHVAIYKWVQKYVDLMKSYLEQITPNVSDDWRADELDLKGQRKSKIFVCVDG